MKRIETQIEASLRIAEKAALYAERKLMRDVAINQRHIFRIVGELRNFMKNPQYKRLVMKRR